MFLMTDERDVAEPDVRPDIWQILEQPLIPPGRGGPLPDDEARRTGVILDAAAVGRGRAVLTSADALDTGDGPQPGHLVTPDLVPCLGHRMPHLANPVHVAVLAVQVNDHVDQDRFGPEGVGDRPPAVSVVAARGDLDVVLGEHPADRLDPEAVPIGIDVGDDQRSLRSSSA